MRHMPGGDGDHLWPLLAAAVEAAYRGDPLLHVDAVLTMGEKSARDEQMIMGTWLSYLCFAAVVRAVPQPLQPSHVDVVADSVYPRYATYVRGSEVGLQDLLCTVLGFPPRTGPVQGTRFLFQGSAVAGIVMSDLGFPVASFLPGLQTWWVNNREELELAVTEML